MKRALLLTLAALAVIAGGCKKQQAAPAAEAPDEETIDMSQYLPSIVKGDVAPDFEAPDIAGDPVKLSDYLGTYVVLDFWASWCKDCRAETPALKQLHASYVPKGVAFLGVSFDTDKEALIDYGLENEITWVNVCNYIKMKENPISAAYGLHWIPTFFVIDPDGKVEGVAFTVAEVEKILKSVPLD